MYIPRYTRYVVVVVVVADAQYLGSAWISFFVNATTRQLCWFFFDASETPHRCTPIQYLACIECSTTVAIKFAKPNTSCEEEATIRGLCKDTHTHMRTDASGCERRSCWKDDESIRLAVIRVRARPSSQRRSASRSFNDDSVYDVRLYEVLLERLECRCY